MGKNILLLGALAILFGSCEKSASTPQTACYECKTTTEATGMDPIVVYETECGLTPEQARAKERGARKQESIPGVGSYSTYMFCTKKN